MSLGRETRDDCSHLEDRARIGEAIRLLFDAPRSGPRDIRRPSQTRIPSPYAATMTPTIGGG